MFACVVGMLVACSGSTSSGVDGPAPTTFEGGAAGEGGAEDSSGGNTDADASSSSDSAADATPPECKYKHPLLDAGKRFCGNGECYCAKVDSCYGMAIAKTCCDDMPVVCY